MYSKIIFFPLLFLYFSFRADGQCSVVINAPDSLSFCFGDSIRLVASGQDSGGAMVLDQSQLVYTAGTSARNLGGYSEWQSFTTGITGTLAQIDIGFFNNINGYGTLNIFAGSGTGGTLLQSQTVQVICPSGSCILPFTVSVPVTAGQVYTFQFIPGSGIPDPYGVMVESSGTYPGGQMALVDPSGTYITTFDMVFETFVAGPATLHYHWSTGSTDSAIVVNASGNYAVTVSDSSGCTSSDTVQVTAHPLPAVNLGNDTTLCSGQTYVLNAGNTGAVWLWQDNSTNQTFSVHQNGAYWVRVTGNGCSASDTVHITYANTFALNLGRDTAICSPDTVLLNATTTGATYHWQDNTITAIYAATLTGNYSVTVTVNTCSASDSISITVKPRPTLSITADSTSFCSGDSSQVCALSGSVTYQWNNGDSSSCFMAKLPGDYYVTVTDTNHCTATSNRIHITIHNPSPVSTSFNGDTLWVNNAGRYQWYLDGHSITGANADYYIASSPGNYIVQVTDSNGCKTLSTPYYITGIQSMENMRPEVFPNPYVNTCLLIVPETLLGSAMEIIDSKGSIVFKSEIRSLQTEMPIYLQTGIYLLRIFTTEGIISRKLVKQ